MSIVNSGTQIKVVSIDCFGGRGEGIEIIL